MFGKTCRLGHLICKVRQVDEISPESMIYAVSPCDHCLGSPSHGENFGPKGLNTFTEVKGEPERSLIKLNVLMFEC